VRLEQKVSRWDSYPIIKERQRVGPHVSMC